jgi:hypothetical protein
MATKKKTVQAKKVVKAAAKMKKYPRPEWSRKIHDLAPGSGHKLTAEQQKAIDKVCWSTDGAGVANVNGKAVFIQFIWYMGYRLALVIGRKKKATKTSHGLEVLATCQKNLEPIPAAYEEELAQLSDAETQDLILRAAWCAIDEGGIKL